MEIHLVPIDIKEKQSLNDLIKEYQKEILNQGVVEEYKYLGSYWQDPDRHPYFIKVDDVIAGFVLVNNFTYIEEGSKSISEFYVKKEFRNKGIGKQAAYKIFDLYPGKWEIRELDDNIDGQKFWQKIINKYTKGNYIEIVLNDKDKYDLVQIFDNS